MYAYQFDSELLLRVPSYSYSLYHSTSVPEHVDTPFFKAALLLASTSLSQQVRAHASAPDKHTLPVSVGRYVNRMHFRPTPFGLFSVTCLTHWGNSHAPPLQWNSEDLQAHLTLKLNYTAQVAQHLAEQIDLEEQLFIRNGSIYKVHKQYRYLRYEYEVATGTRTFLLASFPQQRLVRVLLEFFRMPRCGREAVQFIEKHSGASQADSRHFLVQLIRHQLLFSELQPNITGPNYYDRCRQIAGDALVNSDPKSLAFPLLNELRKVPQIRQLHIQLPPLGYVPSMPSEQIWDLNLLGSPTGGCVSSRYQATITEAVHLLHRLLPAVPHEGLLRFAQRFTHKFDQQVVPLIHALDPEFGVGYENLTETYTKDNILDKAPSNKIPSAVPLQWGPVHALLLSKWAAGPNSSVLELTESDLSRFPAGEPRDHVPNSISVVFRTLPDQVYLEHVGGVSATALLGRFTPYCNKIQAMATRIAQREIEANPHVIFAEVANVCQDETAFINKREHVWKYEIPILLESTREREHQIPLDDLLLSVAHGTIRLWSKRLKKQVVPRLSSAFNHQRNDLAAFRFLCDLQYQGLQSTQTLDLSRLFPGLDHYPRLIYKNAILQLATWHLHVDQLQVIRQGTMQEQCAKLMALATALHWPTWIALTQHDQQLIFNLTVEADLVLLIQSLPRHVKAVIQEFPFGDDKSAVVTNQRQQPYQHQFVASLYHNAELYPKVVAPGLLLDQQKVRKFMPGSTWLYFKIYCHPSRANSLMVENIGPLVRKSVREKAIHQWFFVRYTDPDFHLRLRLNLSAENVGTILAIMQKQMDPLLQAGVIASVQLAVYERELERYGPDLIDTVENCFCKSNELVITILAHASLSGYNSLDLLRHGAEGVDLIARGFNLSLQTRLELMQELYESLQPEPTQAVDLQRVLNQKFRKLMTGGVSILNSTLGAPKKEKQAFLTSIQSIATKAQLVSKKQTRILIGDLMHMHLNRLLPNYSRENELTVYYCMWKYYNSIQAQAKHIALQKWIA